MLSLRDEGFEPWTAPYYGVSHRYNADTRIQLTICEYGEFVLGYWLDLNRDECFTSVEEDIFPDVVNAKRWLERKFGLCPNDKKPIKTGRRELF
jgi:hypothetical protein